MSVLRETVDERFLMHRLKATSIASMAGITVAMGLFAYHFWKDHMFALVAGALSLRLHSWLSIPSGVADGVSGFFYGTAIACLLWSIRAPRGRQVYTEGGRHG